MIAFVIVLFWPWILPILWMLISVRFGGIAEWSDWWNDSPGEPEIPLCPDCDIKLEVDNNRDLVCSNVDIASSMCRTTAMPKLNSRRT